MTPQQVAALGPAFAAYLRPFEDCFGQDRTREHLHTYCRGLLSDLSRKSVEPIAHWRVECAVRTLQEFLTHHHWDRGEDAGRGPRRVAREHLPAPGQKPTDELGVVGRHRRDGRAQEGGQDAGRAASALRGCRASRTTASSPSIWMWATRQFRSTLLDGGLLSYRRHGTTTATACREHGVPDSVVYRPKWQISVSSWSKKHLGNGIRFDWIVFDEGYGGKPPFLYDLDALGGWSTSGKSRPISAARPSFPPDTVRPRPPFVSKRVDNAVLWGGPVGKGQKWRRFHPAPPNARPPGVGREGGAGLAPEAGRPHRPRPLPAHRPHVLADRRPQRRQTGEVKYFVSNAPPRTSLKSC